MRHVLWLASWYPDPFFWHNGDFVQRHAQAVAEYMPLTVIHVLQSGPGQDLHDSTVETKKNGALTEMIVSFRYAQTRFRLLNKITYNWKFFSRYKAFLKQYIAKHGKPDLVHVHIPMKAGRMALWLKKEYGIPYLVTEHSSAYSDEVPDNYQKRGSYYRKWVKAIFEQAEAVTTVSQKLGMLLQQLFDAKKIHIIPNVVNTRYFNYPQTNDASGSSPRFRFLHASTMDHPKNIEGILRALQKLKAIRTDWECNIFGWNHEAVQKLSADLNLHAHVKVNGSIPYSQVAVEMQHSKALLMFSRYENQPCVILEALCCGLPVITTAVGGIPEVVNETNGILVQPENEEQLLQAMLQCMRACDHYNRLAIAQQAQSLYSYEAVGKQFVELYDKCEGGS